MNTIIFWVGLFVLLLLVLSIIAIGEAIKAISVQKVRPVAVPTGTDKDQQAA